MHRTLLLLVAVPVSLSAAQAIGGNIQMPRLFNPPPPRQQVAEAQIWDPYPLYYVGHPDSTRPRDFFYGPPEATIGRYPNPGTFPRSAPWARSQAPADYPNIRKRFLANQAAKAGMIEQGMPAEQVPADKQPAEVVEPPPAEARQASATSSSGTSPSDRPRSSRRSIRRSTGPTLQQPATN